MLPTQQHTHPPTLKIFCRLFSLHPSLNRPMPATVQWPMVAPQTKKNLDPSSCNPGAQTCCLVILCVSASVFLWSIVCCWVDPPSLPPHGNILVQSLLPIWINFFRTRVPAWMIPFFFNFAVEGWKEKTRRTKLNPLTRWKKNRKKKKNKSDLDSVSPPPLFLDYHPNHPRYKKRKKVLTSLTDGLSLTLRICSLSSASSSKVAWAMMEKTRMNPWPFFMYRSRIAVNCSVPAVSRISSIHWWPSTSTCFR